VFSPLGNYLATGGGEAIIKIWKVTDDQHADEYNVLQRTPVFELKEHASDIIDLSWHCSGTKLLSTSFDQKVILWQLDYS
jgi:WD40 repeat protein